MIGLAPAGGCIVSVTIITKTARATAIPRARKLSPIKYKIMTPDKADNICPSNIFFGFAKGLSCTAITKTIEAPNGGISQIMPSNDLSRKAKKLIKIKAPSALNNALIILLLFINDNYDD